MPKLAADLSGASAPTGAHAAAAYLRELLFRPGRYRRKWERYASRSRAGQVNQLAVAEVLAHYLWEHPRSAGDAEVLPRQLKDTAGRALSGKLLSKAALTLLMDAFDIAPVDRSHLWLLWQGAPQARMLSGPRAVRPEVKADMASVLGPAGHHTVTLHDHLQVGASRLPVRARTFQVVEATRPGLDRIPYIYDTCALSVETGQGCKGLAEPLAQIRDGMFVSHILLADVLDAGENLTLEYWTSYSYPPGYNGPDGREYRRVVMGRLENVGIRVEFDAEAVPSAIWWAVWDGMDGGITDEQPVELDSQYSVHRYLRMVERTVFGFHWTW
jgi:hypothetical protein